MDRFSDAAGTIFKRSATGTLPAANAAINFDDPSQPFLTKLFGPDGTVATVYDFDVQSPTPATAYLFVDANGAPVPGQLPVIDVLPGQTGYSDFFQVSVVTVPAGYLPNSLYQASDVLASGLAIQPSPQLLNWVVVPVGSTAALRFDGLPPASTQAWYRGQVATYLAFGEHALALAQPAGTVPTAPLYAATVSNGTTAAALASGLKLDANGVAHSVVNFSPGDLGYAPLWSVNLYDNAAFSTVTNLSTASAAASLATQVATLNAPVVQYATQKLPQVVAKASVDRFSDAFANLWKRSGHTGFPAANAPVNFDDPTLPFAVHGYGPGGQDIHYYNFDVTTLTPGNVYLLTDSFGRPVPNQLLITDAIPGDTGYSDIVQINTVTVPDGYIANSLASLSDLQAKISADPTDYALTAANQLKNLVTVAYGSTANLRLKGGPTRTVFGWYRNQLVSFLDFDEGTINADTSGLAPHIDIYVTFNKNPDPTDPTSGPPSGFKADANGHVHNVVSVLPPNSAYSPIWDIDIYDNAAWAAVDDLPTALAANLLALNAAEVNCPVVAIDETQVTGSLPATALDPATAPPASVDRFSDAAGTVFKRSATGTLPAANAAINFDDPSQPFLTKLFGPDGTVATVYDFDVQSPTPATAYLFVDANGAPVPGQLPVIDVLPGQTGYSDFFQVSVVTVPAGYLPNSLYQASDVLASGLAIQPSPQLLNWVVVPAGSTAALRFDGLPPASTQAWYRGQVATYLAFGEHALALAQPAGTVPTAPLYAATVSNGTTAAALASGLKLDANGVAHSVVNFSPGDLGYAPLWSVNLYDNAAFSTVTNLSTASAAASLATQVATLNAPVVQYATQKLPQVVAKASVDRFSDAFANLWKRSGHTGFPAANAPVNFDDPTLPFAVHGYGPGGQDIHYYNFDVTTLTPGNVYLLTDSFGRPVPNQLLITDAIPGDTGYSDIVQINTVTVPDGYIANSLASLSDLQAKISADPTDYTLTAANQLKNLVTVAYGSTANLRLKGGPTRTAFGWYRNQLVSFLDFDEGAINADTSGLAPHIDIYVTFNKNPDPTDPTSGPPSGFKADANGHVHNVVSVLPPNSAYSPIWDIDIYDNAAWAAVDDLPTALAANLLALNAAEVNCPVVQIR